MKYLQIIFAVLMLSISVSSITFAQEKKMMKKDKMKKEMMDKKDMMKDKMSDDMMMNHKMMIDKNMDGVAIKGYDPVSYFTEMKPMMGDKMYSHEWMGAKWQFTSKENKMMFVEYPEKYAPQFGGYCAYGVSVNGLYSTDPTVWKIVDGKLYLNKNKDIGEMFKKDVKGNIMKAEKNWPNIDK